MAQVPQEQNLQGALPRPVTRRHGLGSPPETRHLDGGHGGVEAFVAVLAAGTRFGLLHGIGGEHSERDRHSRFQRDLLQSARGFAARR